MSGDFFILRAVPIIIVAPILVRITGKVDPRWMQAIVTTAEAGF